MAAVARDLAVPARKLRDLIARFLAAFAAAYRPTAAHGLGIDGIHLQGETWTVIADIEGNCLIDLLASHDPVGLAAALAEMERREVIGFIAIDASTMERRVIRAVFPPPPPASRQRVVVTLDRRHAIALVLKALTSGPVRPAAGGSTR